MSGDEWWNDNLAIWFSNGNGMLSDLTFPSGEGNLVLSRRDKALALALLEVARETVEQSVER